MRADFKMAPEEPKWPWKDGWINTKWSIHTMEYLFSLKTEGNSDTHHNVNEP